MATHVRSLHASSRLAGLVAEAGDIFLGLEDREALASGRGVICLAAQLRPDGRPRIGFSFSRQATIDDVAALFPKAKPMSG